MGLFKELFTWWSGNTIGTRLFTWRKGHLVGEDTYGNRYYEQKKGVGPLNKPRRWVIYTDVAEASLVPSGWHSWLHYRSDDVPAPVNLKSWQKPHEPNYTGTSRAYKPHQGKDMASVHEPYQPWSPSA